jgi:Na+/H+ antiporter NhaD/arsenite permease-like protein
MIRRQLPPSSDRGLLALAAGAVVLYVVALAAGLPQRATAAIAQQSHHAAVELEANGHAPACPPLWTVVPFVLLLAAIAVLPLLPGTRRWWHSNLHRFYVAAGLGLVTLLYYFFSHHFPVTGHWPVKHLVEDIPNSVNVELTLTVLANAILYEYVPFIVLLLSLFVISGGIRIEGDLPAHPGTNAMMLAIGGLLASLVGTTGAAMLLIRPLLETNRERKQVKHTVVFFIFVVCNCGGCLLPLGDPPLFLGYLLGVPFCWTLSLWPEWLLVNGLLIAIYYAWDRLWCYPREAAADVARDETRVHRVRIAGLWPNAMLLCGVLVSVALLGPSKPLPGTNWHPWLYLREVVQLAMVAASLIFTHRSVRVANQFNYEPILEVAALFLGIFICMQPPLEILNLHGPSLPLSGPADFFYATGGLSAVLDNAPTYVVFFETARSLGPAANQPMVAGVRESLLAAISLGAVFMGAMTYIGNGPNFMVKSIAQQRGVAMPGFFGYMLYSFAFLLPVLLVAAAIFL